MPKEKTNNTMPKGIDRLARQNARRYALQAIYQWQITLTAPDVLIAEFLYYHIDKKIDLEYFKILVNGVLDKHQILDQQMKVYLDRPLQEIDWIEKAVLRIAIYELSERIDVPYRVIINEALELTKKFGSIDGYKFVNGILDRIAKKIRADEIKPREVVEKDP